MATDNFNDKIAKDELLDEKQLDNVIGGAAVPVYPEFYPPHLKVQQNDGKTYEPNRQYGVVFL